MKRLKCSLEAIMLALLLHPTTVLAQYNCAIEAHGRTVPNTSGTPVVINPETGTVISANFFGSGAIDPPYFDGQEFVSVCILETDRAGVTTARITTDVGLDDDTHIKGYPQFLIGTKFGNQFETSYRYYENHGLDERFQWPVIAENYNSPHNDFEFANLEYVANYRGIGLPAFTSDLPEIIITLDIDEENVGQSERDVMLESWFYDTSANADSIGNNHATGAPIVNTLNNIVGIGHRHYPELDNTLLEMMVHIGALSPNDVSRAKRNPGQNQLTENFSGKDSDGDGIDDHFDVDSHINADNGLDPQPGIYSSGIDENGDGIDDADLLPVQIGSFLYSIWYGESFLSPIIIFSRETNSSLTNDFDPLTPDMDLTSEGEITLPWNEFLDFTMYHLQPLLANVNVSWAIGTESLFTKISSPGGAIGGVEFGIEPQINNNGDLPYTAIINKFDVSVNGTEFGLTDRRKPFAQITSPLKTNNTGVHTITGEASDDQSGTAAVSVRVQKLGVSPAVYWNGTTYTERPVFLDAVLSEDGTSWSLADVFFDTSGKYRTRIIAKDTAGNVARVSDNPITDIIIGPVDTQAPTVKVTLQESIAEPAIIDITGTATDDQTGVATVSLRVQKLGHSPRVYWDGTSFSEESIFLDAILSDDGNSWVLPDVFFDSSGRYRIRVISTDNQGNIAKLNNNPITNFQVGPVDNKIPKAQAEKPENIYAPATIEITGTASDNQTGVATVAVRVQKLGVTPAIYWDGTSFTEGSKFLDATLSVDSTSWTLPGIQTDTPGNYRIRVIAIDNAGNIAKANDNPITNFTVDSVEN